MLALPPFRGMDEFDHAYRAVAVAHGQWLSPGRTAADGRGELLTVTPGIVRDAGPACAQLQYTGHDNCHAASVRSDGTVTVASAAARYNPVFYWVVGTAARPFDGVAALYAMRLAGAVLCSLTLALAAWATGQWARTRWPLVALVATLTPVAAYSTVVAAPNGIEACAAVAVWSCLVGLVGVPAATRRRLILVAALTALPLAGVRGLGPLWLAAALVTWLVQVGPRAAWQVLRCHPRLSLAASTVVVGVTLAATVWTLRVGSMELETGDVALTDPWRNTALAVPLWFLQSVAAFPYRDQPAPMVVYAAGGLAVLGLLVLGWHSADRRLRWTLTVAFALALGLPFALQVHVYEAAGDIWQGRYGWPLSLGVLVLAGYALDRRPPTRRTGGPVLLVGGLLWVLAHAVSTTDVLVDELRSSPLSGDPRWVTGPPWLVPVLTVLGVLAWCRSTSAPWRAGPDRTALRDLAVESPSSRPLVTPSLAPDHG